jgi:glycosyltransferase involved in cell wall biosynthesis
MTAIDGSLRIAQVAPALEAVPPPGYGGTERVVDELARELQRRGHRVTLFASADSTSEVPLVPTVERALRPAGRLLDEAQSLVATLDAVLRRATDFDLVHAHLEFAGLLLARATRLPVAATFHGRLDRPWAAELLAGTTAGLCAVSAAQASAHPAPSWWVVHNGLALAGAPFQAAAGDELCFVGRMSPEKGAVEAVEIARLTGRRLRVAAKEPASALELDYYEGRFLPATRDADVELLGELAPAERDRLFAESHATLMPGDWPEPFGLVAIESLACGTPIVGRRVGGIPEIVRDGLDGILDDSVAALARRLPEVGGLDRAGIRASVLERFSVERMADEYERVYAALLAGRSVPA